MIRRKSRFRGKSRFAFLQLPKHADRKARYPILAQITFASFADMV